MTKMHFVVAFEMSAIEKSVRINMVGYINISSWQYTKISHEILCRGGYCLIQVPLKFENFRHTFYQLSVKLCF